MKQYEERKKKERNKKTKKDVNEQKEIKIQIWRKSQKDEKYGSARTD